MLYEKTSKACKWWIERQIPPGYKWVPKTKKQWVPKPKMHWVPKAKNDHVQKRVSFAVDNAFRITNVLKRTNSLGSNLSTVPSSSNSLADYTTHPIHYAHVPSQQELDLLFGPLYAEFFSACSNPQDKQPLTNIQPTLAPSTHTIVHAEEKYNDQAEEREQVPDDEFTNPFFAPPQKEAESSSYNIEQVHGNPLRPVQTRRQLATDPEMCMYALTVSTTEPKNIKEVMADYAWIEAMQEELHQFDRLHVWELVDKPFGKMVIKLMWLWKNKKDEDQTEEVYVAQLDGFIDPDHPEKVYRLRKALYRLKQAPRAWYDELSKFLTSKGFYKGLQIHQSPHGILINQAKYTLKILHKYGMDKGQSIGAPMATKLKLDADLSGNPVDQTDYHSKIGSLMYLTSSRPNIVQAGSSFGLTAFLNVDHVGCIDSRKSTFGGIQFLGDKLISWMSKNQNCTAMSSTKAEYVALSASCAQVMWMKTQLQDYGFNYNKIPLYYDSQSAIAISCNLANLEEAKTQDNGKLQSALEDMVVCYNETKELLMKEREIVKTTIEKLLILQEVPVIDHELMNKLTAKNEKLKSLVGSLEQKISDTEKIYEEKTNSVKKD
nr:hypothetical protein [Tanacetum cinerariifolium]